MIWRRLWLAAGFLLAWNLALCPAGASSLPEGEAPMVAPRAAPCPPGLPAGLVCLRGRDSHGAFVLMARPANWHGGLVTQIFGGPRLAPINAETTDEDLLRFAEYVADGWAWVSTSRRRPGFGISRAGEDALAARRMAEAAFGRPRFSVIHGQSWGGAVAARAIETLNEAGPDGIRPWNAALLTSAVLAGPVRAYDMRVDLRAAFAAVCGTHPRPEEPQYTLTLGLPRGARMPWRDLMARYTACTGADLAEQARSPRQRQALQDLSAASRIPPWAIPAHLGWSSYNFADIAWTMMEGRSAFGNAHVRYSGTSDDAAFNARVPRITPDPDAQARLAADGELTGAIGIPVITLHGIGDSTVFVEHQAAYRETLERAGSTHWLLQVFTADEGHARLSGPIYAASLAALRDWVHTRRRPDASDIIGRCESLASRATGTCRIQPDFRPGPWAARVNPR